MSVKQLSETFLSHSYWVKDGDNMPWLPYDSNGLVQTYDGSITTAVGGGAPLIDVNKRTDTLVEALSEASKVLIKPPNGTVSLEFRFRSDGTAEGDQEIIELHAAAGVDHYTRVDVLTVDRGLQEYSSTIFFYDKVVSGGEKWITVTGESDDTNERIGRYNMNTHGYDRFCFVMTTKDANTTNFYVDWRVM